MLINRRQFLKIGLGTIALGVAPPRQAEKIRLGMIGLGSQGSSLLQALITLPAEVEIVALCDVQPAALEKAAVLAPHGWQTTDYLSLINQKEVQAVVIATPDFTHAEIAEAALRAGLDIYLEPPIARTQATADALVALAPDRIVQMGVEQASHRGYQLAHDILAAGTLGKISRIEATLYPHFALPAWQHSHQASDGIALLLLTQVYETVRQVMNAPFPTRISAQGGVYVAQDGRTTPDTFHALLSYPPGFLLSFSMGLGNSSGEVFKIYGTHGTLDLLNWQITPAGATSQPLDLLTAHSLTERLRQAQNENTLQAHLKDWLMCIHSRQSTRVPMQSGYEYFRLAQAI